MWTDVRPLEASVQDVCEITTIEFQILLDDESFVQCYAAGFGTYKRVTMPERKRDWPLIFDSCHKLVHVPTAYAEALDVLHVIIGK